MTRSILISALHNATQQKYNNNNNIMYMFKNSITLRCSAISCARLRTAESSRQSRHPTRWLTWLLARCLSARSAGRATQNCLLARRGPARGRALQLQGRVAGHSTGRCSWVAGWSRRAGARGRRRRLLRAASGGRMSSVRPAAATHHSLCPSCHTPRVASELSPYWYVCKLITDFKN